MRLTAALALVAAGPVAARGAVIVVETTADGVVTPLCELANAILAANEDKASGPCSAGSGPDVIEFAPGVVGTIELEDSLPAITDDVEIRGPGVDALVVSGQGQHRVFLVESGEATIRDLTIADGLASDSGRGGGIQALAGASLWLEDCRVTGCAAFDGGGIAVDGATAVIERCTVDGNSTTGNSGAGIVNSQGTLEVNSSTISGNATTGVDRVGGGIATFGDESAATTTIRSSTVSDNSASGGGNLFTSELLATTALEHTVLANAPTGGNCGGVVVSHGYNLSDDLSCGLTGSGDLEGVDAQLDVLADNGGPTPTHLPLEGSPLVDGGDPSGCPFAMDQRGFPRPTDGAMDGGFECDIGSVEVAPEPGSLGQGVAALAVLTGLRRRRAPAQRA